MPSSRFVHIITKAFTSYIAPTIYGLVSWTYLNHNFLENSLNARVVLFELLFLYKMIFKFNNCISWTRGQWKFGSPSYTDICNTVCEQSIKKGLRGKTQSPEILSKFLKKLSNWRKHTQLYHSNTPLYILSQTFT